jgi:hypothetical protein
VRHLLWFSCLLYLSSCYRDISCDCYKKKGCRLIFAIQVDSNIHIVEKQYSCPTIIDYDKDTIYKSRIRKLTSKYDSIAKLTKRAYKVGFMDSLRYDTTKIKGVDLQKYKSNGYACKCYD